MESKAKKKDVHKEKAGKKSKSKTKAKKEHKHHKRGLLDILDTHACIGSEIGVTGKEKHKKKLTVKDSGAKPYMPSLKSIPASSLSEDSDVNMPEKCLPSKDTKKSSRHKKKENEYSQVESYLPKIEKKNKDANYQEREYTVNTLMANYGCDHYPVRVKRSKDTLQFSDILPEASNDSLLNDDHFDSEALSKSCLAFRTIAYSKGKKKKDEGNYVPPTGTNDHSKQISDSVYPIQYDNSKKHIELSKISQRDDEYSYTILGEKDLRKQLNNGNIENKTYQNNLQHNSSKPTLCVYDCNKYPLTDSNGNILKTANGDDLIILKNGRPYKDCFKRLIYDKKGESSDSCQFNPYDWPIKNNDVISKIPLYDFRGYPLTDNRGASLINANGKKLIVTDHQQKLLYDINGNPIFDESGIPVTKKDNCWLNPRGTPYRVFNKSKYPLTDHQGMILTNRNKTELIKVDKHGRPIFDFNGEYAYDANGYDPTNPWFNPVTKIENELDNALIHIENAPTQIFDKNDFPLTDAYGMVLRDAAGKNLLKIDLNCNLNPKKLGINTTIPCKFLGRNNNFSHSLISSDDPGEVSGDRDVRRPSFITYTTTEVYNSNTGEKPLKDKNGGYVYDYKGQQVFLSVPSQISKRELGNISNFHSLETIDSETTIKFGNKSAYFNQDENPEIDFETEMDKFGRPLYDDDGAPLFDKYGRPVKDLFLRPLYDSKGCPISTANGKLLSNGLDEMPGILPGFDLNYLTLHDPEKRLKLNDRFGGPIHDSSGQPLYNSFGKPYKDAFDRPLYNDEGNPLCDDKGFPASPGIQEKCLKIQSVEDKFQKLTVSSHNQCKSTNGGPQISPEQENDSKETYWARVRLTTFENEEKAIELLEIVPAL